MLRALRAELVYSRPWILGGLGIAAFVVIMLSVLVRFFEEGKGPPIFVVTMFPIIAGMVVSFIAQGYRVDERRARLLLSGSLTPGNLAGVTVLLPVCLVGISVIAAFPLTALAFLITSKFEPASTLMAGGFAAQFLAYAQLGPLAQESTAARRQRRHKAALIGWAVFAGAILLLAPAQFYMHTIKGYVAVGISIVTTMVVAAILYRGRTDYTK